MNKQDRLRNEHVPDVEVVTALITAINEAEKRAFRYRMSSVIGTIKPIKRPARYFLDAQLSK